MSDSCLLLLPRIPRSDAELYLRQSNDTDLFFLQAIRQSGLHFLDNMEKVIVDDTSPQLIEKLCSVDIAVFDTNIYPSSSALPAMYYLIALRHSLSNKNLLLTRSTETLPSALRRHHTLTYNQDEVVDFYDRFRRTVEAIRSGEDSLPDNPIQEYLRAQQNAFEFDRMRAEIDRLQETQKKNKDPQRIAFHRVR